MLDLGTSKVVEDESSGMCSPTLWAKSSPQHHNKNNNYRNLSPESKIQAIERGQRELMEMVRNMPESCYELTLKDLVVEKEKPKVEEIKERNLHLRNKIERKKEGVSISNNRKVDKRNGNIDSGGFYLKMVFPISMGSKSNNKKKKELLGNNHSSNSKVLPRTSSVSDKEWWKKKSESNNSGGSSKSYGSSSSRSNSRHEMSGSSCWPFLRR